jgi:hypothetical protein
MPVVRKGQLFKLGQSVQETYSSEPGAVRRASRHILHGVLQQGGAGKGFKSGQEGYQAPLLQPADAVSSGTSSYERDADFPQRCAAGCYNPWYTGAVQTMVCPPIGLRVVQRADLSRLSEVKMMAERIIKMRDVLYDALVKLETPGDWGHIKSQIGMLFQSLMRVGQADNCRHVLVYRMSVGNS